MCFSHAKIIIMAFICLCNGHNYTPASEQEVCSLPPYLPLSFPFLQLTTLVQIVQDGKVCQVSKSILSFAPEHTTVVVAVYHQSVDALSLHWEVDPLEPVVQV